MRTGVKRLPRQPQGHEAQKKIKKKYKGKTIVTGIKKLARFKPGTVALR
jgi:hypothetical protein